MFPRYTVRPACADDIEAVLAIDRTVFNDVPLGEDVFRGWLEIFPQGFMVAQQSRSGAVVAYGMAIRMKRRAIRGNWKLDTADGTCRTHDPNGEILYGVSLGSIGRVPGAGAELCRAERHLVEREESIQEIHLIGRLRGFAAWKAKYAPDVDLQAALDRYVQLRIDDIQDFYDHQGLMAVRGVTNYLPEDEESLGCAVWTVWTKPSPKPFQPVRKSALVRAAA